jgi:hypothetical protein
LPDRCGWSPGLRFPLDGTRARAYVLVVASCLVTTSPAQGQSGPLLGIPSVRVEVEFLGIPPGRWALDSTALRRTAEFRLRQAQILIDSASTSRLVLVVVLHDTSTAANYQYTLQVAVTDEVTRATRPAHRFRATIWHSQTRYGGAPRHGSQQPLSLALLELIDEFTREYHRANPPGRRAAI